MAAQDKIQKSGLDEIVNSFTSNTLNAITNMIGKPYQEILSNYLTAKHSEIMEETGKIGDNTKKMLLPYLSFLTKSGKIYEYSFGIALANTGYLPRTVKDVVTRSSAQEDRERREISRFLTKVSFEMLPKEIQEYLSRRSINEVQRAVQDAFEKELIYLKNYLINSSVSEKEIEPSLKITLSTLNLFPELVSQQYLILSKIFKPEALEEILGQTIILTKDTYGKLYDIILDPLKVKEEPKKEETKSNQQ